MMTQIKSPLQCTREEISEFRALVMAGRDVIRSKLRQRIKNAYQLLFYRDNESLCGVSALKCLSEEYRYKVFEKAKSTVPPNKYLLELGWVFITEHYRGQGISRVLVESLLPYGERFYCTTRADNQKMQRTLTRYGFCPEGVPYKSERGDYELILMIYG